MLAPTKDEMRAYEKDGYFIRKGFLKSDEVTSFRDTARQQLEAESASGDVMHKGDKAGNTTLLKLWNSAGDDQYGLLARDERMVRISEVLIGSDIYLYSHKMTMKQPREGGAWEWHQDFGYWYDNACLAPEMLSIYVSLDKATQENGCLQANVQAEHLDAAVERYEHAYVEMEPGDALIFHCNLLHRSDANKSDSYRWGYIVSYNAVRNAPFARMRDYGNFEELVPVSSGSFMVA
jgi:ectoine hydroxylase-related dioxygenase (phytanoyl-CoA dioxygenase family)